MLQKLGLLDTVAGLVLVYIALLMPIAVWVMIDFFAGIPKELDEMAMIDGCTPIGAFFRVILPNSIPGLVVAGMFCIIFGWNDFFFAFTLTFTQTQLLPVAIVSLNSSVTPWWSLSAFALISISPLILIAFVVESYMSKGSLSGAIRRFPSSPRRWLMVNWFWPADARWPGSPPVNCRNRAIAPSASGLTASPPVVRCRRAWS